MSDPSAVPEGWYEDGTGRQRWWDGEVWTDHYADPDPAVGGGPAAARDTAAVGASDAVALAADEQPRAAPVIPSVRPMRLPGDAARPGGDAPSSPVRRSGTLTGVRARGRRPVVLVVVAVVVIAVVALLATTLLRSGGSGAASQDVAAARTCEAVVVAQRNPSAVGGVVTAAAPLGPKWSSLQSYADEFVTAIQKRNPVAAYQVTPGLFAICATIPSGAQRSGGYRP